MALITESIRDHILFLEFNDPTSRNSFSVRAAEELAAALGRVAKAVSPTGVGEALDEGLHSVVHPLALKGVIFSAPGRVFCSGGNLSDYALMTDPQQGKDVNRRITAVLEQLARFELPTICVVGGDCFGGGVELVSAFDRVISVPYAIFGLWQRRIALTFGWGGGARLERRLGPQKLRSLALSTETFTAGEARTFGLVDAVVSESSLMARAIEEVNALARLPKAPVKALKTWVGAREQAIFEELWMNDEHRAVLARRGRP